MADTSKRAFTEEHLERLQKGAERRNQEQIVGNYLRRVNKALFHALLNEALHPLSPSLVDIIQQAEAAGIITSVHASKAAVTLDASNTSAAPQRSASVEHLPESHTTLASEAVHRPPPPRMNIT